LCGFGHEGKNLGKKDGGSFDTKVAVNGNPLTKVYVRLALMKRARPRPKGGREKISLISGRIFAQGGLP